MRQWWVGVVVATSFLGTPARGAVVTWGPAQTVSGNSDVSTSGSLVEAANTGGNSSGSAFSTTVNGVLFAGWLPAGAGTAVSPGGHFRLDHAVGHTNQSVDAFGSGAAPFTNLSAEYQTLLRLGNFSQNASNANDFTGTLTLTITGLVINTPYQFQWWTNDSRPFATGPITATTGATSVSLDPNVTNAAGGVGQWAIGTFTADATSQVVVFSTSGNGNLQNAFQLRAVPEPGAGAVLGVGLMGVMGRRKRKRET